MTDAPKTYDLAAVFDEVGWRVTGDAERVFRSVSAGDSVDLDNAQGWPVPDLPDTVANEPAEPVARLVLTDMDPALVLAQARVPSVVVSPRSLVVGMGCRAGTPVADLRAHLRRVFGEQLLAGESLAALVSVDRKAEASELRALADELAVPFRTFDAGVLDEQDVPNPSDVTGSAVGTRSVAEAAVLAAGAVLVVPKQVGATSTVAVGRLSPEAMLGAAGGTIQAPAGGIGRPGSENDEQETP